MTGHLDARETRDPAARARELLARLPALVESALRAPGWQQHLGAIDPRAIDSRAALAQLRALTLALSTLVANLPSPDSERSPML